MENNKDEVLKKTKSNNTVKNTSKSKTTNTPTKKPETTKNNSENVATKEVIEQLEVLPKPRARKKKPVVEKVEESIVEETTPQELPLLTLAENSEQSNINIRDVVITEMEKESDSNALDPTNKLEDGEISILDIPEKRKSFFELLFPKNEEEEENKETKRKRERIKRDQIERYHPDIDKGLSDEQVDERDYHYLTNHVDQKFSKSYASIICGNLFTFFNLLGVLVTIGLILAKVPLSQFTFCIVYILNISIGIIQEVRAKHSIERLSLISTKTSTVLRNGEEVEIASDKIVLDDLIKYSIGKQIVTDGIILQGEVEVNESLLTGESIAVKKSVGDKLFAASYITSGTCICQAIAVGSDNYIQKLSAKAKKYKKPNSELMRSLSALITIIGFVIIPIAAANILTQLAYGKTFQEFMPTTAGVIIGMIPAGMFLLTSMALAIGVIRLARHNTLVQDLYSLEMLARVDVLCLDKTGTITDGRMKVSDCIILNSTANYTISEIMGSMLSELKDNNQTSVALYNHFGHSNALKAIKIVPFSSEKKLSAVTFAEAGTFAFGAPEFVLKEIPEKLNNLIRQYASMGLRVLVLGHSKSSITASGSLPSQFKPLAIITITDSIRENAPATISWFKNNDVALKVISGDNPLTVSEIARRVGIPNADKYISLEGMSERDVIAVADSYTVFGRVSPEQKAILVKALKLAGHNVAMTGDGVNDILAMKEADCAVSLASGSDAARNIAHLVLIDNNFNSMPKVVKEGRRVINNIQNSASLYLMKTLFTMMIAIISLIIPTIEGGYPFVTSNMLLLELCVIGIPSFFLSLQPNDNRVEGNFINYVITKAFPCALLMVISCVLVMCAQILLSDAGYFAHLESPNAVYTTMMVYAVTFSGLMMLYRICKPFNLFRSIMFTICFFIVSIVTGIALFNGMELIGVVKMTPFKDYWHHLLIVFTIIMVVIPLSSTIDYALTLLRGGKKIKKNKQ